MPRLEYLNEGLPVKLWVEVLPVDGKEPKEFKIYRDDDRERLVIRKWSFVDVTDLEGTVFQNIQCGKITRKIVEFGTENGNMENCWWLNYRKKRMDVSNALQAFISNLIQYIIHHWKN